ncbi:MAG: transketolase C-terminal domain-containing protein, partial [Cytophagales bacterium]
AIRYPRGEGVLPNWRTPFEQIEIGKGRILKEGDEVAVLTLGHPGNFALKAVNDLEKIGLNIGVFDMRFAKPLDEELLKYVFENYKYVITVEDGCLMGGFGSAVLEFAADNNYQIKIKRLGMPDYFVEHGEQWQLYQECGYSADEIKNAILKMLEKELVGV